MQRGLEPFTSWTCLGVTCDFCFTVAKECHHMQEECHWLHNSWFWCILSKAISDSFIDAMFCRKRNLQEWGTPSSFLQFVVSHAYSAGGLWWDEVSWPSWQLGFEVCRCLWLGWMTFRNGLKKNPSKKCPSKKAFPSPIFELPRMDFVVCPWSKTLLPSMLKRRRGWCPGVNMFCQRFTKIHQYQYMEGRQMGVLCCRVANFSMMFVALDPVRIGWRAKAGKLSP